MRYLKVALTYALRPEFHPVEARLLRAAALAALGYLGVRYGNPT